MADHDDLSPMEILLEGLLTEAHKTMAPEEVAATTVRIFFRDSSTQEGIVRRGPVARTYIMAGRAADANGRPLDGILIELAFHGVDILRIATTRKVEARLITPESRIVTLQS